MQLDALRGLPSDVVSAAAAAAVRVITVDDGDRIVVGSYRIASLYSFFHTK